MLIDFLNQMLPAEHKIVQLSFKNTEQWGEIVTDKKAVFDLYCHNEKGKRFLVEMQKAKTNFFKDRSVFYSTFPIKEQADKGEWNIRLSPVYCVAILDFEFDDDRPERDFISHVHLKDQFGQIFYNKLQFIYLEMPRFTRGEDQLENHFHKWIYFLKHLEDFDVIPEMLQEEVFLKGFEIARIANFSEAEMAEYETSLKHYRDIKNALDTSYEDGREEGIAIGIEQGIEIGQKKEKLRNARELKRKGIASDIIAEALGLPVEDIETLQY